MDTVNQYALNATKSLNLKPNNKTVFRIKKYPRGFVVEVKRHFLWVSYWKPFIYAAGLEGDVPWYYQTYKAAKEGFLSEITIMLYRNDISDCP